MQKHLQKFLAWHVRRTLSQLGLFGVAGLGLFVFCAMFYFSAVLPAGKEVLLLKRETDLLRTRSQSSTVLKQQPANQLDLFYKNFPGVKGAPDALERLYQAAATQGVTLEQGEYHLVRNGSDKLVRYEMSLPVKGDYLHLRKFLSQMLMTVPHVSLDSVDFQRQKISDTMLEAQVKMTLYFIEG